VPRWKALRAATAAAHRPRAAGAMPAANERQGANAMNRRSILGAALAAAPAALATPALAQTQNPELRWRLASSFAKNLDSSTAGPSTWRSASPR
jgi:hypothetical protein